MTCSNRTSRNRQKLEHRKVQMNMRNNLRMTEHWRMPKEAVKSGDIQNHIGTFVCNPV